MKLPNFTFYSEVNTRQWLPFSFSELWYSPLELNSTKIHQDLTNWTRWNKHDKVWGSGNSLFKWRFCIHDCRCCLSSLMPWDSKEMFHNDCLVPFLHMNNFFSCFGFWLLHRLFKFWRNDFLFIYKRNNFIILIEDSHLKHEEKGIMTTQEGIRTVNIKCMYITRTCTVYTIKY